MYNKCFTILLLMVLTSCTLPMQYKDPADESRLRAENRLMKKRMSLALSQNEILKSENRQIRAETREQQAEIRRLTSTLDRCRSKYDGDINLMKAQYNALQMQFESFRNESDTRIQAVSELNKVLEETLTKEKLRCDAVLESQTQKCNREIQDLASKFQDEKQNLETIQSTLREQLQEKNTMLENMKNDVITLKARIHELESEAGEKTDAVK